MSNTGQTAVYLKDLIGNEYPAVAVVNRKRRVNGQREISLSFLYTEINKDFMDKLEMRWQVLFKGEWYTITHPGFATDGDFFVVNVTAILSFFVDLNGYYLQDKAEDKSFTAGTYFNAIFAGTPYNYVMVNNFAANSMNFSDNESRTQRFLYGVDRFGAEFKVVGNVVYLYNLVGSDKDVILHEDLNVNSVRIDVDASGFHTWAKGFGDLPEDDSDADYQLEVDYRSPLIAKYGEIEGPAIKDGNFKHTAALTEAVKNQVENSYTISTEIEAVDLTNNGYPEMTLDEGDRVWLVVSKLDLNQQVRIMEVEETFDWEGNKIDTRYVVGNEGIASRYKTQQYDTINKFRDVLTGKKPLEFDWLPEAIKRASDIINGNLDSHFKYGAGEIIGINKSNPDGYMRFNTDGIGFSRDGGKTYRTAMTYEGIVADAITTGRLNANNVTVGNNRVLLDDTGLGVYANGVLGAKLTDGNLNFHDKVTGEKIGEFSGTYLGSYPDIKGISMNLLNNKYMSFGYYKNQEEGYRPAVSINMTPHFSDAIGQEGFNVFTDATFYGTAIRSFANLWMGAKTLGFGPDPRNINSHIYHSPDRGGQLIVTSYAGIDFCNTDSDQFARPVLSVNDFVIDAWQDLDMHGWKIHRVGEILTSSSILVKTNIEDLDVRGLDIINNLQIKKYHLQKDVDQGLYDNEQVGVISELSPEVASDNGTSINLYKMASYNVKATQELSVFAEEQKEKIAGLETVVGALVTENEQLKQQLLSIEERLAALEDK